jgi:amino acid adenylation domain-containing protein
MPQTFVVRLPAELRRRAAALRAADPGEAELRAAAVAALTVHYTEYAQACYFDLHATATGKEVRQVRVTVDPDMTPGDLAKRIAEDAPADHDDATGSGTPRCLVVLGATPADPAGHAFVLRFDPDSPAVVSCLHDEERTTADEAATLAGVFATLLGQVLAEPGRPLREYAPLSPADRHRVLATFNRTDQDFPADATVHSLFRSQARSTPDQVAVSSEEGTLTYRELDELSERLAYALINRGVRAGGVVGVLAGRSLDLPVALLGILKAGCAYLPLDPQAPQLRLRDLVERASAAVVLVGRECPAGQGLPAAEISLADPALYARAPSSPLPEGAADDLAYVIYTSGSTGRPKGVMVEHRSVVNRLAWMQRRYPLGPGDTLLQKTPTIFDVSVWELFWWLLAGARMHLLAPGMERFPMAIVETVERQRVTAIHFVPSMLNVFLEHLRTSGDSARLASLRWVFSSGESLAPQTVTGGNELLGGQGTRLVNLYGPTEATVDVTAYDCPPGRMTGPVPIGRPIDNTRCYVLRHGQPMPVGVFGTLHLAGAGVARGYLGDPELTRQRFVPEYGHPAQRMYDTGDIGRWLPSGDIEFLGRGDLEVKLRGIRINLLEIENVLLEVPGVADCAVILDQPAPTLATLRAVVSGDPGLSGDMLRSFLAERLPAYMVPSTYDYAEHLPRVASGKVDRRRLLDAACLQQHARRL